MKKKIITAATASALIVSAFGGAVSALTLSSQSDDVKVYLNGEDIYVGSDNKPCIMNDRTMVQIKPIFEKLNYRAVYDDSTKTVVFYSNDNSVGASNAPISFTNDSYFLSRLDNEDGSVSSTSQLDVPATIYNNTFYVPLRAFCEAVGSEFITIAWDASSRSVYLSSNIPVNAPSDSSSAGNGATGAQGRLGATAIEVGSYRAYTDDDLQEGIANLDISAGSTGLMITYQRRHDVDGESINSVEAHLQSDGNYIIENGNRKYILSPNTEDTVTLTILTDSDSEELLFIRL